MKNKTLKKFDYKWIIVALSFLMILTCLGFCSSNKSIYLSAITSALNIERSVFSLTDSFRYVATAIVNIFFGTLISKYGPKKLICAGFVSLILSCILYATATNIWLFYLGGLLLGIGFSWTTTTMVSYIVHRWCKENQGTIMGAILAANGLGGALAAQIVTPIIYQEGNPFGYRQAYWLIVGILIVVGTLIVIFFKNNPPSQEQATATTKKKKGRGQNWIGMDYSMTKKKAYFYFAAICIFLTGLILQSINGIAAAHMQDVGLTAAFVGSALSIHSLALAGFKFLTGIIYDKFGLRITMNMCDIAALVAILLLASLTNSPAGMTFAMIYAVLAALALPLETIMLPIFASDLFGDKSFDKVLGIFVSVNTTGYALGGPLANAVYDIFGSYKPILLIFCAVIFGITVVFNIVLSSAKRDRDEILKNQ